MTYCSVADLGRVLPEKVKIGDANIGTPIPGSSTTGRSNITPQEAQYYIEYAQQYIDSKLKNMYVTPLRRIKVIETYVLEDIPQGLNSQVVVHDTGAFNLGDLIRLQDSDYMETCTVKQIDSLTKLTLVSVSRAYSSTDTMISRLIFPEPIPVICARMACAFILDRIYVSEQSPDVSKYGANQRTLAINNIDDILTGTIILQGQDYTGRRFIRGPLIDAYGSPYKEHQKGQEKET